MTSGQLFPAPPARVFRFVWIGKRGPTVKTFSSIDAFSGYISEVRRLMGLDCTEFRTPTLCIGVLK